MKIYLAVPYTHISPFVRERRFEMVNYKAAELMKEGHIVFSPISHSHPIAVQENLPLTAEFWQQMNESFLDWCDSVYVYRLAGWQGSTGIQSEIEYAIKTGKPVIYID